MSRHGQNGLSPNTNDSGYVSAHPTFARRVVAAQRVMAAASRQAHHLAKSHRRRSTSTFAREAGAMHYSDRGMLRTCDFIQRNRRALSTATPSLECQICRRS